MTGRMVYFVSDLLCTLKAENLKKNFFQKNYAFSSPAEYTHGNLLHTATHNVAEHSTLALYHQQATLQLKLQLSNNEHNQ